MLLAPGDAAGAEEEVEIYRHLNKTDYIWRFVSPGTVFDALRGDLLALRGSGGDYAAAGIECLEDDGTDRKIIDFDEPSTGNGYFYLVRGVNCGGGGTYDAFGPGQAGPRDPAITASSLDCVIP